MTHPPCGLNAIAAPYAAGGLAPACPAYAADTGTGAAGAAAGIDLDMAERIEVLRGPFSVVYGNHAGGVIHLFTRDGRGSPVLESSLSGGSDGMVKLDVNAEGETGNLGYMMAGLTTEYRF